MAVRAGMVLDGAVEAVALQARLWVSQSPMDSWGARVRQYRRLMRRKDGSPWTQEDLAEAAGIDRRYIGRIETGEVANPEPETVQKLADALHVEMFELGPRAWYRDSPTATLADVIKRLRSLKPDELADEDKEAAASFLRRLKPKADQE